MWDLIPRDVTQSFTWLQNYIQQILNEKWASVESILSDIVDLSKNAKTSTPLGDMIDDNKTQLAAKKMLLEMAWVYKSKWMNINFDFNSVIFDGQPTLRNNKKDNGLKQATVINQ